MIKYLRLSIEIDLLFSAMKKSLGLSVLRTCMHMGLIEAGCDEAGRGCLAGPICAAAVVLPPDYKNKYLNDSKKVGYKLRGMLRKEIMKDALAFSVAFVDETEIDRINILNASILAMHMALSRLKIKPEHILIDGNRFISFQKIPFTTVVKGDGIFMNIAAASILAKTSRDQFMEYLHLKHPVYNWKQNKGYPTAEHRQAFLFHGPSEFHRTSFIIKSDQLK
jgi:ribonuclease HII